MEFWTTSLGTAKLRGMPSAAWATMISRISAVPP